MTKNKEFEKMTNISTILFVLSVIFLFVSPWICFVTIPAAIVIMIKAKNKFPREFEELKNSQQKNHAGAWFKKFNVTHIQGINFVNPGEKISCLIDDKNISFCDSKKELFSIAINEIKNALILEEIEQTQKNKSVIARAIVGGVLLGPIGAIVGGVSGVSPELKTNKKYFLEFTINESEKIIITTNNKDLKQIKTTVAEKIQG